ncbi:MAG TPA: hypothetical protein VM510_12945 [Caulifigura sp.]|nr:hypothetical protein [Caulifigura sp.]
MLAHPVVAAFALFVAMASSVSAQIVGHYPGPSTRYEWNNRPYSGGWSYGGNAGYGGVNIGIGIPWGGYGYGYYAPYAAYGGPVVVPPYGYDYGAGYYGGFPLPPSTATFGYVNRPIFTAPFPPQLNAVPPPVPVDPLNELQSQLNAQQNRDRPLPLADRLPTIKPSTPEQQQRSLRHMATADQQFKIGHYAGAALEYRRAIADAEDLPDNYFRLGFALACQRRYDEAVQQWKYGLMLDNSWPTRGESLTSLFGENNTFEKTSLLNRVGDYVRLDPRDPNRIFLLGVLLHFNGDQANARTLFESATRVAGNESWLTAFLGTTDSNLNTANSAAGKSPPPPPAANTPQAKPVPPASDVNAGSIPAPPPANVNRPRTNTLPPAGLNPDEQPVPKRSDSPSGQPEKFPGLQAPKLPGANEI